MKNKLTIVAEIVTIATAIITLIGFIVIAIWLRSGIRNQNESITNAKLLIGENKSLSDRYERLEEDKKKINSEIKKLASDKNKLTLDYQKSLMDLREDNRIELQKEVSKQKKISDSLANVLENESNDIEPSMEDVDSICNLYSNMLNVYCGSYKEE